MAEIYCDANLSTGANDGSSWENAFRGASAIATAFSASASGDTIMVAAGDYANSGFRTNNSLSIVAVDGPYKTTMRITSNPPGGFWFFQSDNRGDVGAITIDGFRYTSSLSNYTMFYGAAVLVRNCIFSGLNQNSLGQYITFANCLVSGCTFSSFFNWRPSAYNCTFIGNSCGFGTPLNIANCIFAGNTNNNVSVHSSGWCRNTFAASVPSGSTGCIIGTDAKTDADGKLIAGSPCIGAGSASYLQTPTDLVGTPWRNPPAIGCYEFVDAAIKPTIPTRMLPFGV